MIILSHNNCLTLEKTRFPDGFSDHFSERSLKSRDFDESDDEVVIFQIIMMRRCRHLVLFSEKTEHLREQADSLQIPFDPAHNFLPDIFGKLTVWLSP